MSSSRWLAVALVATACACHGAGTEEAPEPSAADAALQCARTTMQAGGFRVRLRDPRDPWTLIGDAGASSAGANDLIVVKVVPSADAQGRPLLAANAQTSRPGILASADAREIARRVEARCGGNPFER